MSSENARSNVSINESSGNSYVVKFLFLREETESPNGSIATVRGILFQPRRRILARSPGRQILRQSIVVGSFHQSGGNSPPAYLRGNNGVLDVEAPIIYHIRDVSSRTVDLRLKKASGRIVCNFHNKPFLVIQIYITVEIGCKQKPQKIGNE